MPEFWAVLICDFKGDPSPHITVVVGRDQAEETISRMSSAPEEIRGNCVLEMYPMAYSPSLTKFITDNPISMDILTNDSGGGVMIMNANIAPRMAAELRAGQRAQNLCRQTIFT